MAAIDVLKCIEIGAAAITAAATIVTAVVYVRYRKEILDAEVRRRELQRLQVASDEAKISKALRASRVNEAAAVH